MELLNDPSRPGMVVALIDGTEMWLYDVSKKSMDNIMDWVGVITDLIEVSASDISIALSCTHLFTPIHV